MVCFKLKQAKLWLGAAVMAVSTSLTAMPQAWQPADDVKLARVESLSLSASAISAQQAWTRYQEGADTRWLGLALSLLAKKNSLAQDSSTAKGKLDLEQQLLKARVLQALHQFDQSLALLLELQQQHPDHAGIRLLMSWVRLIQGETREALRDCESKPSGNGDTVQVETALLYEVCRALVAARTGRAEEAYGSLKQKMNLLSGLPLAQRIWSYGVLAELADQQGLAEAKQWYAYSLAMAPDDVFSRLVFADYLYRQQDWRGLQRICQSMLQHPRFAIWHIAASLNLGQQPSALTELRGRMAEIEQRQDPLDYGDLAWYWISVEGNAGKALSLAQRNWQIQQGPEDARLLMMSAQASGDQRAIKQVNTWHEGLGARDQRMKNVAQRWGESL